MRWIRTRLTDVNGNGTKFTVPYPTYYNLILDTETPLGIGAPRWALVLIGDDDDEPEQAGEVTTTVNVPGIGPVVRQLAATHKARWIEKLKRRYPDKAATISIPEV